MVLYRFSKGFLWFSKDFKFLFLLVVLSFFVWGGDCLGFLKGFSKDFRCFIRFFCFFLGGRGISRSGVFKGFVQKDL